MSGFCWARMRGVAGSSAAPNLGRRPLAVPSQRRPSSLTRHARAAIRLPPTRAARRKGALRTGPRCEQARQPRRGLRGTTLTTKAIVDGLPPALQRNQGGRRQPEAGERPGKSRGAQDIVGNGISGPRGAARGRRRGGGGGRQGVRPRARGRGPAHDRPRRRRREPLRAARARRRRLRRHVTSLVIPLLPVCGVRHCSRSRRVGGVLGVSRRWRLERHAVEASSRENASL